MTPKEKARWFLEKQVSKPVIEAWLQKPPIEGKLETGVYLVFPEAREEKLPPWHRYLRQKK